MGGMNTGKKLEAQLVKILNTDRIIVIPVCVTIITGRLMRKGQRVLTRPPFPNYRLKFSNKL